MVEVFKTTVTDTYYAKLLLRKIHARFPGYQANFDLSDCDRILRIEAAAGIEVHHIILIVQRFGYHAEVLADEVIVRKQEYA